jgi:hypothetical protein
VALIGWPLLATARHVSEHVMLVGVFAVLAALGAAAIAVGLVMRARRRIATEHAAWLRGPAARIVDKR